MPVCAGLVVWGMLDGATRGRCLIVLWGRGALSVDWFWVHGSYGGRGLHAWLRPGRHLDLYIVFWMALHVVGVSLFCEAGKRCVSHVVSADWLSVHGSCGGRGLHAWLRPGRHLNVYIILLLTLCVFNVWTLILTGSGAGSVILDFAGRWVWGRGPRGVVPGRPEWQVNASCVDVYIRELDARGA